MIKEQLKNSKVAIAKQQACVASLKRKAKFNKKLGEDLSRETIKLQTLIDTQTRWMTEVRTLEGQINTNKHHIATSKRDLNNMKRDYSNASRDIRDTKKTLADATMAYKDAKTAEKAVVNPTETEIIEEIETFKQESANLVTQTANVIKNISDMVKNDPDETTPGAEPAKGSPFIEIRKNLSKLFAANQKNAVAVASFCYGLTEEDIAEEGVLDLISAFAPVADKEYP